MITFTKPFFVLLALIVALTMALAYRQFVIEGNFQISARIPCDPAKSSCFISDCDPQDDLSCITSPYLKVQVLAAIAPVCLEQGDCQQFACPTGASMADCQITPCTPDTIEDGEHCTAAP